MKMLLTVGIYYNNFPAVQSLIHSTAANPSGKYLQFHGPASRTHTEKWIILFFLSFVFFFRYLSFTYSYIGVNLILHFYLCIKLYNLPLCFCPSTSMTQTYSGVEISHPFFPFSSIQHKWWIEFIPLPDSPAKWIYLNIFPHRSWWIFILCRARKMEVIMCVFLIAEYPLKWLWCS